MSAITVKKNIVTHTEFFPSAIPSDTCNVAFEYLKNSVEWKYGIRSKNGPTRLAKPLDINDTSMVSDIVRELMMSAIKKIATGKNKMENLAILGVYLNYYQTSQMYTPNHSHPGTSQIIISLGGTRTLTIGKKSYVMSNGDVSIFGGSVHGVPKEDKEVDPRISIAVFCKIL